MPWTFKNTLYRISVHSDSEIVQGIPDSGVSPRLVFVRHFHDKIGNPISHPRSPRASITRPVVLSGDEVPEPTQKRIRRNNSGELPKGFPSERFCFDAKSTPLFVSKSEATAFEVFPVHSDLFDEIVDYLLPIPN